MVSRTIWLARHGNREDFVNPHWRETAKYPYDPDLSLDGIEQAQRLAQRMATQQVDAIYSSPFLRTIHTAFHSAQILNIPIRVEAGLAECLDDYHGSLLPIHPSRHVHARFPRVDASWRSRTQPYYPEAWDAHLIRCRNAMNALLVDAPGSILCISHGTPCTAIVCALTGLTEIDLSGVPGGYCAMELCALTRLDYTQDRWALTLFNDKRHLLSDDWIQVTHTSKPTGSGVMSCPT